MLPGIPSAPAHSQNPPALRRLRGVRAARRNPERSEGSGVSRLAVFETWACRDPVRPKPQNRLTANTKYDKVTTMRETTTFTVSLPPAMAEQVELTRKAENRTRSELVREALRVYLSARVVPAELPTAAEARAYRRGMAAYKRGNYVTLEAYLDGMDRRPRRASKKSS